MPFFGGPFGALGICGGRAEREAVASWVYLEASMAIGRIVVSIGMMVVTVGTGRQRSLVRMPMARMPRARMPMASALVVAMAEAELCRRAGQAQERNKKAHD